MREAMAEHVELKRRLSEIEPKVAKGFTEHEQELTEIRFLIEALQRPIEPKKNRIGF